MSKRTLVAVFEQEALDRSDEYRYLVQAARLVQPMLAAINQGAMSYGMVHGDVIRANALVADNGQVTVLDFDFCAYGWRNYDLASYLLTIRNTPQEQAFEKAFLEGYEEIRSLSSEEQKALALFEAVRAIISIGTTAGNIEHWGSQYFYAFLDNDVAALMRIEEIWAWDLAHEARHVRGTTDVRQPFVAEINLTPEMDQLLQAPAGWVSSGRPGRQARGSGQSR